MKHRRISIRILCGLVFAAILVAPMSATAEGPPAEPPVFAGDFETGKLPPWVGQCANTGLASDAGVERGSINLTVRLVGQGKYAARFNLPAAPTNTACEVVNQRRIGLGDHDYYGLMFLLPRRWHEPSPAGWGLAIAQLGFQGIWGSPISLNAHARNVALVIQTGLCRLASSGHPGCAYSSGPNGNLKPMLAVPSPLALGVWHELILHVYRTTDSSGVIEVWHRLKGQKAWKQTVSVHGYPTVQWTPERLSVLHFNATVDKIGAYRGKADFPVSVWLDGFVRTTSFAAAAAALP